MASWIYKYYYVKTECTIAVILYCQESGLLQTCILTIEEIAGPTMSEWELQVNVVSGLNKG